MRRRRATSQALGKSSRARSSHGSFSPSDYGGDDYPLDDLASDDLPVRDIREDEEGWHTPDSAGPNPPDEHRHGPASDLSARLDAPEIVVSPSEGAPSHADPYGHEPTPESLTSEQGVEAGGAERPAQPLLPGLEPPFLPDQGDTPQRMRRSRRSRASSDKYTLKAAQTELWPQPDNSVSEP
jgi:hypothetical protein